MKALLQTAALAGLALAAVMPAAGQGHGQYPAYSGPKKIAVIMLAWSDKSCPATRSTIVNRVWNDALSTRKYYLNLSRGVLDFALPPDAVNGVVPSTTSAVYGPYTLSVAAGFDKDITYANADDYYGYEELNLVHPVAQDLAAADGFNAANYDYVMYITPGCDTTGSLLGYSGFEANYQHIFSPQNWVINHEVGHSIGMHHSNTGLTDNYSSRDCVMANGGVPHIDGPHTYQMGWYPDSMWSMAGYGQYDIENLAQPDSDNLKLLCFNRVARGASTNVGQNFWIEYRKQGVGLDSDLNASWDRKVTVHQTEKSSRRPGDAFLFKTTNEVANLGLYGSYTDSENLCQVRFVRENLTNGSATVQLVDPKGNQPPTIAANQAVVVPSGTTSFSIAANDPDNDALSYSIIIPPATGSLTHIGGRFTYSGSVLGAYSFTLRVNDGQYDSFDVAIPLTVVGASSPVVGAGADQTVAMIAGNLWTPDTMRKTAWYDAADAATLWADAAGSVAATTTVARWDDKSGEGRHLTQTTAAKQPSRGLGSYNGRNVVTFQGAGAADHLLNSPSAIPSAAQLFCVGQYTGLEGTRPTMLGDVTQSAQYIQFTDNDTNGIPEGFQQTSAYFNGASATGAASGLGNASLVRINKTVTSYRLCVGNDRALANRSFSGHLAEILIFSSLLPTADQQRVEGYLAWKWGLSDLLPTGHPYKSAAPAGNNVVVDLQGVAADADGDTLSATWSRVSGPSSVDIIAPGSLRTKGSLS